jgi:hypothetical protein
MGRCWSHSAQELPEDTQEVQQVQVQVQLALCGLVKPLAECQQTVMSPFSNMGDGSQMSSLSCVQFVCSLTSVAEPWVSRCRAALCRQR